MTLKPEETRGPYMVTSFIVITKNLEFKSTCQKEETYRVPLKYIDVNRTTHTNLDVLQEKRIDDFWKVDAHRSSSDSWKGFTMFALLNEKHPKRYVWSGWRLAKIRATARPD